jgi:tricorn protease
MRVGDNKIVGLHKTTLFEPSYNRLQYSQNHSGLNCFVKEPTLTMLTRSVLRPVYCICLFLALSAVCRAETQAFLTHPDIHGNQVVFTAEGDLWLADITTGDAWRLTSDPGVETNAHFSPDGTQIAFSANYDGGADIYLMPVSGGIPKRLTYDSGNDNSLDAAALGWTPDGRNVLFCTGSKLYGPYLEQLLTQQLYTVPANGGPPTLLSVPRASFAALNRDGHTLAYVPTSNNWMFWFRYEAGRADVIWLADLQSGKFTQLTNSKGVDTQPVWVGPSLYFVSERSGVRNLWKLDPATKKTRQVTFSTDLPVRYPSSDGRRIVFQLGPRLEVFDPATGVARTIPIQLHSDRIHARPFEVPVAESGGAGIGPTGKRVALVARGHMVTVPIGEGSMHALVNDSSQRVQHPAWSPDGKCIAYVSDASGEEQLYLLADAEEAQPKQLTRNLTGEHGTPVWSPDAKSLLLGNRTGDIQLIEATTGAVKTVAHSEGELGSSTIQDDFCFSPNSKWVAYSTSLGRRISTVFLYEVATGKSTLVSDPGIDSSSPVFSPDGKYLFLLQDRSLSQIWTGMTGRMNYDYATKVTAFALAADTGTPFQPKDEAEDTPARKPEGTPARDAKIDDAKIDIDGIRDRYLDMKVPAGKYSALFAVPGRLLLQSASSVLAYDIATSTMTPLANDVHLIGLSHDGKKLLVGGIAGLQAIDPSGGLVPPGTGALKLAGLTVTVDPVAEWRQIFYESWRVARDFFYDPNMHGIDWQAVKARYEAQLPLVASRYDLTLLTRDMISELNTGHTFAGAQSEFQRRPARPGQLGVDLVWDNVASAYQIKRILRGDTWSPESRSPFAEPGINVKEGDYLLKIHGNALRKDQDPAALLLGTANHTITVMVNSRPTLAGARTIWVTPIANDRDLRLQDWVKGRRAYVEKVSGGQIAYVYLSDMSATGASQFAQSYFPNVDKPGIIIDVRGNGGGNISGNVLNDLASHITGFFGYRAGDAYYRREGWAPLGQVVAVTNEWAFSDGDYFSEFFKRLKIGPLVGHRTGGGVVGSNGYTLVDGGAIGIPNYGAWVPGEWIVEGRGAVPDFEVDQDPTAVMAGKDPQLDKAIEIILDNLKKHPFKKPVHPPFPVKLGGSRG